jgi:hypothetical protein
MLGFLEIAKRNGLKYGGYATMRKSILVVAMLGIAGLANATTVQYSTTGTFSNPTGSGVATITNGGSTIQYGNGANNVIISFAGQPNTDVVPPQSSDTFGTFTVTVNGNGNAGNTNGADFDLHFIQTGPTAGTLDFLGTISEAFFLNAGSGSLTLSPPFVKSIATIQYTLSNTTVLAGPTSGNTPVPTSLQGLVNEVITGTPEPGTMTFLGIGFTGLAMLLRRRTV